MMKTIVPLVLLSVILCGCWRNPLPADVETSAPSLDLQFHIEFTSEPLSQTLSFDPWGLKGSTVAVGDITGDGQPEVVLARGGWLASISEGESGDLFYGHPVTFSWNGESFERLEANWVGIVSYSEATPVFRAQGTPRVLMIADADNDGMNEVIVGTMPYRDASQRGAVYVFQWDGERFVAEFSDYCMGGVQRLDSINLEGEKLVIVSAVVRPVLEFGGQIDTSMCPQLRREPEEPDTGLYVLHVIGANEYESQPLILDRSSLTALVTPASCSSGVQWVRAATWSSSVPTMLDWATARTVRYDGQVYTDAVQVRTDTPVIQVELADLDGDGSVEIVMLVARGWDGSGLVGRDEVVWRVYRATQYGYDLVYEELAVFSSDLAPSPFYFFTVGDVDNDGQAEIVDSVGTVHKWISGHLHPQGSLIEVVGEGFRHGLENIHIDDIHGDGQNRVIFTGRCLSYEERCYYPRMYIASATLESLQE